MFKNFTVKGSYGTYKNCNFRVGKYASGGGPRIEIWDDEGPVFTVTTNIPGIKLPEGFVIIKNYSENEGIESELKRLNVITESPIRTLESGYTMVPIYSLTEEFMETFLKAVKS